MAKKLEFCHSEVSFVHITNHPEQDGAILKAVKR